jgi:hypothetical protein
LDTDEETAAFTCDGQLIAVPSFMVSQFPGTPVDSSISPHKPTMPSNIGNYDHSVTLSHTSLEGFYGAFARSKALLAGVTDAPNAAIPVELWNGERLNSSGCSSLFGEVLF